MTFTSKIGSFAIIAGIAVVLAGCASVSVKNMDVASSVTPLTKPSVIYVMPFETSSGEFNLNSEGYEAADFKQNLQQMMSAALVAEFPQHLAPAQATTTMPPAQNAWLVCGKFIRVNEGSRLLRSTVGFGAGGTKMETRVYVYNLSNGANYPFLTFETTGGSGAQPGAAVGVANESLVMAAISAVNGAAKGMTDDTKRTSRMITAALSDYMYNQGWISKDQKLSPKMAE